MNKVILLGRLTKAPEIRFSQKNQNKIANYTLAVNRKYVAQGEERQTDFINIVAYSKLAEFSEKYLKQGLQICVCGRIQTRTYEDNNVIKRYVTEIIAEEIDFIGSKNKQNNEAILNSPTPINKNDDTSDFICNGDDLPF